MNLTEHLRKLEALALRHNYTDTLTWVCLELNGYEKEDPVPGYRVVLAKLFQPGKPTFLGPLSLRTSITRIEDTFGQLYEGTFALVSPEHPDAVVSIDTGWIQHVLNSVRKEAARRLLQIAQGGHDTA